MKKHKIYKVAKFHEQMKNKLFEKNIQNLSKINFIDNK